jgi:hypothetical protein
MLSQYVMYYSGVNGSLIALYKIINYRIGHTLSFFYFIFLKIPLIIFGVYLK